METALQPTDRPITFVNKILSFLTQENNIQPDRPARVLGMVVPETGCDQEMQQLPRKSPEKSVHSAILPDLHWDDFLAVGEYILGGFDSVVDGRRRWV